MLSCGICMREEQLEQVKECLERLLMKHPSDLTPFVIMDIQDNDSEDEMRIND